MKKTLLCQESRNFLTTRALFFGGRGTTRKSKLQNARSHLDGKELKKIMKITLLFKARLRYGEISLQDENEKFDEDMLPSEIKENLRIKWQSTADAELLVFREKTTGDYRTIVNPTASPQ